MGVLSIFSRKPERDNGHLMKTQAYDATSASHPPVRGTYPVAGNGPNVLENLSKSQSRLGRSQVSLNHYESAAPAPIVPRYIEEGHRPNSAPNGNQSTTQRQGFLDRAKREWGRGASSPGRQSKSNSPAPGPRRKPLDFRESQQMLQGLPIPVNPPFAQNRRDSLKSNGGKTFVDILDAQSEIRPANFRGRIQATGARDYGEDVADRNIPNNGVDSELSYLQAFHALSTPDDQRHQMLRGDPARLNTKDLQTRGKPHMDIQQHGLLESGLRTKSLNSSSHYTFPKRTSSHIPHSLLLRETVPPVPNLHKSAEELKHGLRLDTQNLYTLSNGNATANMSRGRTRARSFHSGLMVQNAAHPDHPKRDQHPPMPEAASQLRADKAPTLNMTPRSPLASHPVNFITNKSSDLQQDLAVTSQKGKRSSLPSHSREGSISEHRRSLSTEVHTLRKEVLNDTHTSPPKPHIARQNMHSRQSSAASSIASRETANNPTLLAYRIHEGEERDEGTGRVDALSFEGFARDTVHSRPSSSSGWHSLTNNREDLYGYQRSRSLMSSAGKPKLSEIYEYVPLRTSSLRHWSMSSASGTASETSSNPFPRPTSRHTANTSLDLSPSHHFSSADSGSSAKSIHGSRHVRSPTMARSDEINLDDYLSSDDDDAYTPPRQPRGAGEEELLFKDGYGLGGLALPGLVEPIDDDAAPPPVVDNRKSRSTRLLPHQRSNPSLPSNAPRISQGNNITIPPPSKTRRYIVDASADRSSFDDFSDGGYEDDMPPVPRRSAKRLSALNPSHGVSDGNNTADDVIEEERDEKIDVNAAVKLRKEAKARKRAATMDHRKKGKGKENEMERIEALTRAQGLA